MIKQLFNLMIALIIVTIPIHGQDEEPENVCPMIDGQMVDSVHYVGQGNAYLSKGNYTQAIEAYTCGLEYDANYVPAYVQRGYAYAIQGNSELALDDYNRALEIDANAVAAYNNRGMLYTSLGRFGLALTDFDLAIALDPSFAVAYNNRAIVHAAEGHYDLAISNLELAIAIDPDFAMPYAVLGMVYSAKATESYSLYKGIVGDAARLPAGDADIVFNALDISRENGTFSIWLATLTPAP